MCTASKNGSQCTGKKNVPGNEEGDYLLYCFEAREACKYGYEKFIAKLADIVKKTQNVLVVRVVVRSVTGHPTRGNKDIVLTIGRETVWSEIKGN